MKALINKILKRPTSFIVKGLIVFLLGAFLVLFSSSTDFKVLGSLLSFCALFYLITENWRSPLLLFGTLFALSIFTVFLFQQLEIVYMGILGFILSVALSVYFLVLGIAYLFNSDTGSFMLSFITALAVVILSFLGITYQLPSNINIFILIIALFSVLIVVVGEYARRKILQKKKKGEIQ